MQEYAGKFLRYFDKNDIIVDTITFSDSEVVEPPTKTKKSKPNPSSIDGVNSQQRYFTGEDFDRIIRTIKESELFFLWI